MTRSSKVATENASSPTGTVAREIVLEGQIRFRKLSFRDALYHLGCCCRGRELVKLTTLGICRDCTRRNAKDDCSCTLIESCCYHDVSSCYHCGESVAVGHRGPCL